MENKNTKELRGYKAGLKSKLMGAVAMLLVSAIMVSSATYAWFVLSTHPEVKGMSTTVGSNGALEIALLNNTTGKDLSTVKAEVGDSTKGVTVSNETWGNIVDLSNASYGLEKITLYPAALNATGTGAAVTFASHSALLKYAKYGTDGRITEYNFNMMSQKYQTEQQELTEKIERLSAELESEKQTTVDAETWISLLKQYANPSELTAELLNTLIEKIVIHEATTVDGMREQNIDIYYRLIGKIE